MHLTALRVVNLVAFVPSIVIAALALHVVGQGLVGVEAQLTGWFKSAVFFDDIRVDVDPVGRLRGRSHYGLFLEAEIGFVQPALWRCISCARHS
jgi:hypothetical protein